MDSLVTLEDLANKDKLDLILMFGSRVRANVRPESDMDIALYGRKILSETEKIQLTHELCNILRTDDIDLVDLRTASPLLKNEVFKNYKILLQRDPMLLYRLELANLHEMKELEILYRIRRERLEGFVR